MYIPTKGCITCIGSFSVKPLSLSTNTFSDVVINPAFDKVKKSSVENGEEELNLLSLENVSPY
jgi:hypothetical protein